MKKEQCFLELPFEFDIEKLLIDLSYVNKVEWVAHPNVQAYEGSWLITSLTSTDGDTKNIVALEDQDYKDTPLMDRTRYIKELLETFKTKVEAVRFMKLEAGSTIKEHCDKGSSFEEGYARLHIPITTNDYVEFNLNGSHHKMDLGKCYYIDAHNPHGVVNRGKSDRVHLLIDCQVNEWLENIFIEEGFEKPVYKYGSKNITDENVDQIIESFKSMGTETSLRMAKELEEKKLNIEKE